jgi:hypothetical protein
MASATPAAAPAMLQIVTSMGTSRDNSNAHGPGGALGTWAGKLRDIGCPAFVMVLLLGASVALSTGALFYSQSATATTCIAEWSDFSLSYDRWLQVYGLTNLCMLGAGCLLVAIHGCSGTVCTSKMATTFFVISAAFKVAWYIIGGIVYWRTVNGSCDDGSEIQAFGLALFVIDAFLFALAYCARKAQDMA